MQVLNHSEELCLDAFTFSLWGNYLIRDVR